jgi:hypothetical protein
MVGLTRRDGIVGLGVVALCVVGFTLSRPQFAAAHPSSDEHVIDRRQEQRTDNRLTHRVRTVRYVRSDLRILPTGFEPDHYVAADLGDLMRIRLARKGALHVKPASFGAAAP